MRSNIKPTDTISVASPFGGWWAGEAGGTLYPAAAPKGKVVNARIVVAGRPDGEPVTARSFVRTVGRNGRRVRLPNKWADPMTSLGWSRYAYGLMVDARRRGWDVPVPTKDTRYPADYRVWVNPVFR